MILRKIKVSAKDDKQVRGKALLLKNPFYFNS